ncbi:hypothetical protein QUF94_27675 [Peribacillus sp. NJ4]|uniref:hypothetical protein n=1 Tax=Peribacillus TaxID=2675229 RepID=UPI0025A26F0E|nr:MULTISPECIES: hypothetical protein [unclassified Peribacillus]MDM5215097.1 hypothetical protein [Peribacillus sp. NJ4]MDM5224327.1 hypothetical protein [Peribacillus sp. NJ11]
MIKANILILGSIILATILGIFGQGISYFMNENIAKIYPIYYLTGLTMISVFLYLVTYISIKKQKIVKDKFGVYPLAICAIGLPTSLWSLFVLAMWWG